MDQMDRIAASYVAPALQPGEAVRWIGCLLEPTAFNVLGVPTRYRHYVAVGTDRRLMLTEASARFALIMTSAPLEPSLGRPIVSWWYDELGELEPGAVEGLTSGRAFQLHPFDGCGPFRGKSGRYDAFAATPGFRATAQEGQGYFQWVADSVSRRAFPVDPAKHPYVAEWYRTWPLRRARRLKSRANGKRLKTLALAFVAAAAVSFFAFYEWETGQACLSSGAHRESQQDRVTYWEGALADAKSGKTPPACDAKEHDRCICVDAAMVKKEPWLEMGRTKKASGGELCYEAAGIEKRLRESREDVQRNHDLITTGERHRIAAVLLAAFAAVGLVVTIWKTRPQTTPI